MFKVYKIGHYTYFINMFENYQLGFISNQYLMNVFNSTISIHNFKNIY